jgi:hypothetical protein
MKACIYPGERNTEELEAEVAMLDQELLILQRYVNK